MKKSLLVISMMLALAIAVGGCATKAGPGNDDWCES
jgi:predicted small secreted protein